MAYEYLFDFGPSKIKLTLITNAKWEHLGPGKQWLSEDIKDHPYLVASKFKPLDRREVPDAVVTPVDTPKADEPKAADSAPPEPPADTPKVSRTRT